MEPYGALLQYPSRHAWAGSGLAWPRGTALDLEVEEEEVDLSMIKVVEVLEVMAP